MLTQRSIMTALGALGLSIGYALAVDVSVGASADTADNAVQRYTGIGMPPWKRMTISPAGELGACHWYGNGHYSCMTLACIRGEMYLGPSAPTKRQSATYSVQVNETPTRASDSATVLFESIDGSPTIYAAFPPAWVDLFTTGAKVYVRRQAEEALVEEFPLSQFRHQYPDFAAACEVVR